MALVTRALLTAGVLLLVLVAGVSWLVTRQVVTPVRMARRVAERLAAGRLQERLRVSGEDDLARLATSFNQMASNLQRQIRQLEELSRVQRRFVSDVSHELRTPLTTVRMAGDVLHDARRDFDPATARAAELLQMELDRFETLLVDLLEISRFDAGAAVLETDDVNLVDVAHRVVDTTRALAEQRDVRLEVRAPDHPCLAEADVRRVERIVRNLVTNAIDHAHPDGHRTGTALVVLQVAGDDQAAAIAVRDYGVGLGARRVGDGVQPVLARRPGPCAHQRRHRPRALDLDGGHPPARRLAAGVGPAGRGLAVPAHPAPPGRRRRCARARCRWSPRTPRSRSGDPPYRPRPGPRAGRPRAVRLRREHARQRPGPGDHADRLEPRRRPASIDPPGPARATRARRSCAASSTPCARPRPSGPRSRASSSPARRASTGSRPGWSSTTGRAPRAATTRSRPRWSDAFRTDARGAWLGPGPRGRRDGAVPDGARGRRVADLRAAAVPHRARSRGSSSGSARSRSTSSTRPATMLVPEPVFVPRGQQFASSLVNGLLQGPSPELAHRADYLPPDLRSLSVPVSPSGVAEVDLTSDAADGRRATPEQAELLVSQLAWTPAPGPHDLAVPGHHRRPAGAAARAERRVQRRPRPRVRAVRRGIEHPAVRPPGRLHGRRQPAEPRSRSPGRSARAATACAPSRRTCGPSRPPASRRPAHAAGSAPVKDNGEHRPSGLIDHRRGPARPGLGLQRPAVGGRPAPGGRRGAVPAAATRCAPLDVPGISGEDVKDFLVSRDGSRLVAVIRAERRERPDRGQPDPHQRRRPGRGRARRRDDHRPRTRRPDPRHRLALADQHRRPAPDRPRRSSRSAAPRSTAPRRADTLSADRSTSEVLGLVGTPVPGETSYAVVRESGSSTSTDRARPTC